MFKMKPQLIEEPVWTGPLVTDTTRTISLFDKTVDVMREINEYTQQWGFLGDGLQELRRNNLVGINVFCGYRHHVAG